MNSAFEIRCNFILRVRVYIYAQADEEYQLYKSNFHLQWKFMEIQLITYRRCCMKLVNAKSKIIQVI